LNLILGGIRFGFQPESWTPYELRCCYQFMKKKAKIPTVKLSIIIPKKFTNRISLISFSAK